VEEKNSAECSGQIHRRLTFMKVFHFALWSFLRKKGKDPSSNLGGAIFY